MDTIVLGYDGSDASKRALERAAELAAGLSAHLVVVSVSTQAGGRVTAPVLAPETAVLVPNVGAPSPAGAAVPLPDPERTEPPEVAQRLLDQVRISLAGRGLDAEYLLEIGDAADCLLGIADEREADLIVVGSREHGLLDRLLARSVDETLTRRAGRDVLLVH
jgi:nucleotide-binding universal stress UspA family protein